ncbi:MAG TPA: FHA domain-containing protein [Gemmatimonadaceae bacterium]
MDTDTLAELAQSSTRDEFVAKLPHSFLVLEQALLEDDVGFSTQVVDPVSLKRSTVRRPQNIEVLAVVKAPGNPYPDRVSVGRARNCDIVMRDPSVSKLHAHFRVGVGKLELVDIDSQNGTRVNGRALAPHQPAQVANGDVVLFGSVASKLVDAAALYDLLR